VRIGLIGAKLQGLRRAPVIKNFPGTELVVISAAHPESAKALASKFDCEATIGWEPIVKRADIDAVVICTPPHLHAEIGIAAMESGKHVLCEKPLARTLEEAQSMVKAAKDNNVKLKCGFNHRYHPAIQKAKEYVDSGKIGDINFIRCRYGICGRPGYDQEWRSRPQLVGGGHVMEHGMHGIDLCRLFLGDFNEVSAFMATYYWGMKPLEDNGFILMRTDKGKIASIHSSLTQWKNLFCFEVFGVDGYVVAEGLGGSYGVERLVFGKRDFNSPFTEEVVEFRGDDKSWLEEWREFVACVAENREPSGNGFDGLMAMRLVNAAYESDRTHSFVKV
jgi:predicted dehydrogenase